MFSFILSPLVRQCLFVIGANLGALVHGLAMTWPSPMLVKLSDTKSTTLARTITEEEGTWLVATIQLCSAPMVLLSSPIIDWLGRRNTILLSYGPKVVACLLFLFAKEVWHLMLARVFEGFSLALMFLAMSTYTSEIADKEMRGSLGSLIQIFSSLGVVGMLCIGPYLTATALHVAYAAVTFCCLLPVLLLPESPYFLYSKGRIEESREILNSLRRSDEETRQELQMYSENKKARVASAPCVLRPWTNRAFLRSIGIICFLGLSSQLSGYSFVAIYFQTVMQSTRTVQPELASAIFGLVQLGSCLIPIFTSDKLGRKPVLTVTMLAISLGMAGVGIFFWWQESGRPVTPFMNYLPLLAMNLCNIGYIAGFGAIFFTLLPELFDGPERSLGVSIGIFCLSASTFAVTKCYTTFLNGLGTPNTYWMFSMCSALIALFVVACVPETKGKLFSEIQEELSMKVKNGES